MYRQAILQLIKQCKDARRRGATSDDISNRVVSERARHVIGSASAEDFLNWIKEDREFSYYYYDVQQSGACAKAEEAAALILQAVVLDALE
jgi:hypothetical protein